jgi:predicted N-acetyltransferase YhbS
VLEQTNPFILSSFSFILACWYHPNVMSLESIRIERVKLKDLPAMAARFIDAAAPGAFIPITKQRAEALAHNPNADPDDVAMLLATEGERCAGYFGVMPVMLQHAGRLDKVHWLTTWAVSHDYLGKGLGSRLMEEALALGVDLTIVGSKPARRVSAKYGFHEVKPLDYVQIDFGVAGRYNPLSLLLRGLRKLAGFVKVRLPIESLDSALDRFFEAIFGLFLRPYFLWSAARRLASEIGRPGMYALTQVPAAGSKDPDKTRFYRDERVINWMLTAPWVLPSPSQSANLKYEFTDWRQGFEISAWQLKLPEGKPLGYAVLQFSRIRGRGVLKVLDHHFDDGKHGRLLLAMAIRLGRQREAQVIEGPAVLAEPLGSGFLARLLVRRKQRTLQVHPRAADSPLGQAWPRLEQSYVDGDMAFT